MGKLKYLVSGKENTHPLPLGSTNYSWELHPNDAAVSNKGGIGEKDGILLVIIANYILSYITANGLQSTIHIHVILLHSERKHLLTSKIHKYSRNKTQREVI